MNDSGSWTKHGHFSTFTYIHSTSNTNYLWSNYNYLLQINRHSTVALTRRPRHLNACIVAWCWNNKHMKNIIHDKLHQHVHERRNAVVVMRALTAQQPYCLHSWQEILQYAAESHKYILSAADDTMTNNIPMHAGHQKIKMLNINAVWLRMKE